MSLRDIHVIIDYTKITMHIVENIYIVSYVCNVYTHKPSTKYSQCTFYILHSEQKKL